MTCFEFCFAAVYSVLDLLCFLPVSPIAGLLSCDSVKEVLLVSSSCF